MTMTTLDQRSAFEPRHDHIGGMVTRSIVATVFLLLATVALVSPAAGAAAEGSGWARFGHFAPSASAVDVTVDGEAFAAGIDFKTVSEYRQLPSGVHQFEVRPAGLPDADVVVSVQAEVPTDGAITIGAVTSLDGVTPQVFDDEISVPESGESLVRFIHAAPDSTAVDITAVGVGALVTNVPYPEATAYQSITPGSYDVSITDSDTGDVVLEVGNWSINAGEQSTIVVVRGSDGQLDVAPIVDSVAVAVAPVGGVQTGFGGMSESLADGSSPSTPWWALGAGAIAVLGLFAIVGRRREPGLST